MTKKATIILVLILLTALILRFYRLSETYVFGFVVQDNDHHNTHDNRNDDNEQEYWVQIYSNKIGS